AGVVTTLAGALGSQGAADGTGGAARFNQPGPAAVDRAGNLYVGDSYNNTIRKITPAGLVTTLAGLAGSFVDSSSPSAAVAVDSATNVYVADSGNSTIRKISSVGTNWAVTTIAGMPGVIGSADGTNSDARFGLNGGGAVGILAIDNGGNLYLADYPSSIRK